jgi:Fe-S-cluster containining protein
MTERRFACQPSCTKCCEVKGFVYLTESDLTNIAGFLGLTTRNFSQKYIVQFKHLLRLRMPKAGQCHFLKNNGCSIHPVKPVQCRAYPFWPELMNGRAWRAEAKKCPGIGKGELVQIAAVRESAGEMKTAYPTLYGSA